MCGVAAMLETAGRTVDPSALVAMADAIRHRGPDDEGYALSGPDQPVRSLSGPDSQVDGLEPALGAHPREGEVVGLAHRRLSILDLSPRGHGPMVSADGRVALSYNGEVYNYRELADELSVHHDFQSDTDTEVVLAAYLRWGPEAFERLNGMWGLALWDGRRGELVLSRDRLGVKPLYVSALGGLVAAASEPRALLALGVPADLDWRSAYAYLAAGYADLGDRTMFRGIRQVLPGTVEVYSTAGERRVRRYWSPPETPDPPPDAVGRFRWLFLDSVRLQLRSDVPVGTCLSGGLDSSSIAGAISEVREPGQAQHAFTASFPGEAFDESRFAEAVVHRSGLDWHRVEPTGAELADDLDRMILAQGEPVPSSSSYAQYRVMALARDAGVTVLLDGQGGDELLGGYSGYAPYVLADAVRRGDLATAWAVATAGGGGVLARAAVALAPPGVGRAARLRTRARGLASPALAELAGSELIAMEGSPSSLHQAMRRSLALTTLPVLLRSEDRSSMAHSREARVPFLDHRLVELAASVSAGELTAAGQTKLLLRRAIPDLLPEPVLGRRDKRGFETPESSWLDGPAAPIVEAVLADLEDDGPVDAAVARSAWSALRAGDSGQASLCWRVACFELWRRGIRVGLGPAVSPG